MRDNVVRQALGVRNSWIFIPLFKKKPTIHARRRGTWAKNTVSVELKNRMTHIRFAQSPAVIHLLVYCPNPPKFHAAQSRQLLVADSRHNRLWSPKILRRQSKDPSSPARCFNRLQPTFNRPS